MQDPAHMRKGKECGPAPTFPPLAGCSAVGIWAAEAVCGDHDGDSPRGRGFGLREQKPWPAAPPAQTFMSDRNGV